MTRVMVAAVGIFILSSAAQAQTIYWKKDYIRDASGAAIAVATPAPSDTEAPNPPGSLSVTEENTTSVSLSWSGTTNEGGYVIYRNAVPVGAVPYTFTSFTDYGLQSNMSYAYRVVAFDNARNYSLFSETEVANTTADAGSPSSLVATASSTSQVNLTWNAASFGTLDHYGVWRRSPGTTYTKIDNAPTASYSDNTVAANSAYLYRISAENASGNVLGWSNVDLATTIIFTDSTITAGVTPIRAAHVTELRAAINAVRTTAGLGAASWTNATLTNAWVQAIDVSELRTKLGEALNALVLAAPTYEDPGLQAGSTTIKRNHIEQLRQRVR